MRLTIEVTQRDIDAGTPCKSGDCPIARAMSRAGLRRVAVNEDDIYFDHGDGERGFRLLPRAAEEFIMAFDHGRAVHPFEFEIEVPDHAVHVPVPA